MSAGDKLVFYIETNDLLEKVTLIHLICTYDLETELVHVYHNSSNFARSGDLDDGLNVLERGKLVAGHNICQYDIPVMQ